MINAAYASMMAAYNAEMNRRVYAAAGRLSDEERRQDRGTFWRSIQGTLRHLLWADRTWMSRFENWEAPTQSINESVNAFPDFREMAAARAADDAKLSTWASALPDEWFLHDQTWYSSSPRREMRAPRTLLVMHLFNHQTHHRGQVHAMLTAAGEDNGRDRFALRRCALKLPGGAALRR